MDDVFRVFERTMDEMFDNFGFNFSIGRMPPSSFGFGVVDGPETYAVEDEPRAVPSIEDGSRRGGKRSLSLRDEMLKAPGATPRPRRNWDVVEEFRGGVGDAEITRRDSDLDSRLKEGGLDAVLREVKRSAILHVNNCAWN
jgi:hypothetical protein